MDYASLLGGVAGLAGGVGGGGSSQTPPSSSATSGSQASQNTSTGPVYGGGVNLGPNVTWNPVALSDRVHNSGDGQINAPVNAMGFNATAWLIVGVFGLAFVWFAARG